MANYWDEIIKAETAGEMYKRAVAQSQSNLVEVPKGFQASGEEVAYIQAQEALGRNKVKTEEVAKATQAAVDLAINRSTRLPSDMESSVNVGEKLAAHTQAARKSDAAQTALDESLINVAKSELVKTKTGSAEGKIDADELIASLNLDNNPLFKGSGSNSSQATRRLDTTDSIKRNLEAAELIKTANDVSYTMPDGRNSIVEYQKAADMARASIEKLAESRANNPIRHLLFGDDTFFAAGEVQSSLSRLAVARENLEQIRGSRKNILDFVTNYQNELIKQSGATMSVDPESDAAKADAETYLRAMVDAQNDGNLSIDLTQIGDLPAHAKKFGVFLSTGGQQYSDLFAKDSQAILDSVYNDNFIAAIDESTPLTSIMKTKANYPEGSLQFNKLADTETSIHLDFQRKFMDVNTDDGKKFKQQYDKMKPEEQLVLINDYSKDMVKSYGDKGVAGLLELGANVYVPDPMALLMENVSGDDEYFKSWIESNNYKGAADFNRFGSDLVENTRNHVLSIENPLERQVAAQESAKLIQKTFKQHQELVEKNSNLFFSLKNKPYLISVGDSKAFKEGVKFPMDFTNFGVLASFLVTKDK